MLYMVQAAVKHFLSLRLSRMKYAIYIPTETKPKAHQSRAMHNPTA